MTHPKAGSHHLMARGKALRSVRDLGTVGNRCWWPSERKVTDQALWEGAQAASQGSHRSGEPREAWGSLGCRRGPRCLCVLGSWATELQCGSLWAAGSRRSGHTGLSSPPPLPSEVPIIEHLLTVWVQRPVIAFTYGGGKFRKPGVDPINPLEMALNPPLPKP